MANRRATGYSRRTFLKHGAAAGVAGWYGLRGMAAPPRADQWVILVTIDTLRADHCSCYGYPRPTTPFLDGLAARSTRFTRAYAQSGATYPSHTCMFSGLETLQTGVVDNRSPAIDEFEEPLWTLPQMYADQGYDTAAFVSIGGFIGKLAPLFNTFNEATTELFRSGADTLAEARAWLATKKPNDRVFLWVHTYDVHEWVRGPQPAYDVPVMRIRDTAQEEELLNYWTEHQHKFLRAKYGLDSGTREDFSAKQNTYDARIRYTDDLLQGFFAFASERGPADETLWLLTADHGESLGGHGISGHSTNVYNATLHVPLIMHHTGGAFAPGIIEAPVAHIDLMPTLAALAGEDPAQQILPPRGISLLPLLRGETRTLPERILFAHRGWREDHDYWSKREYALLHGDHKYLVMEAGNDRLYDLNTDPYEVDNLRWQEAEVAARLQDEAHQTLARFIAEGRTPSGTSEMTEEEIKELEALGYF